MNTNTETMSPADVLAALERDARTVLDIATIREARPDGSREDVQFREIATRLWSNIGAVAAMIEREASLVAERDAYREVLREFQDGRRISNPHTRQVARDIQQQALARSEARNV